MQIHIETFTGKVFPVWSEPSDTIQIVKGRIQDREGVSPQQQRLFFEGVWLSH
jgi:hypothetical protein